MDWRFLLDENIDPKTARYLEKEDVYVEHVQGALGLGADDTEEILPYARENDLIVVTSDVSDFGRLDPATHAGVALLYDDTMRAYRIATGILTMIDAYPARDSFPGYETLDPWCRS